MRSHMSGLTESGRRQPGGSARPSQMQPARQESSGVSAAAPFARHGGPSRSAGIQASIQAGSRLGGPLASMQAGSRFSGSRTGPQPSVQVGPPTQARAGHAHHTDAYTSNGRFNYTVCKCSHPETHSQAFRFPFEYMDVSGQTASWETLADRILDIAGKESVGRQEYVRLIPQVFHPHYARMELRLEQRLSYTAARGGEIRLNPEAMSVGQDVNRAGGRVVESGVAQPTVLGWRGGPDLGQSGGQGFGSSGWRH